MNKALYWSTLLVMCLLPAGCQRQQEAPAALRMKTLQSVLVALRDVEIDEAVHQCYLLRDLVLKHGNRPADSVLLDRAEYLLRQVRTVLRLLGPMKEFTTPGEYDAGKLQEQVPPRHREAPLQPTPPADTIRQRLQELDRQAFLLGKATPYTRASEIMGYLDVLSAMEGDTANTGALLAGLQAAVARHTSVLLAAVTRQLESHSPHRLRLIPVVRATLDQVREGAPYRVEVFPLEIFIPPPGWPLTMYANGKPVPMEDGIGKVRFKVEGPPGRRTWEGKLTLQGANARDTSFYNQSTYVVLPE